MSARWTWDDWKASLKARIRSRWQRGLDTGKRLTTSGWRKACDCWLKILSLVAPPLRRGRDFGERLIASGLRKARDWWREILAGIGPFVPLSVLTLAPEIPAVLRPGASIGTIAAVQGAVTGLSLIALVLAVELARRQEDRDDTVYDIMLRAAGIRPTFVFALSALLATLGAVAFVDFSVVAEGFRAANILLCAYVLTGGVVAALLWTVLRTVHVLRPTGVIDYRFQANDRERQGKVVQFVSKALNEVPKMDPIERLLLPHRPVGLTATERLFVEIDDAIQSGQAARFSGALQRLRDLIEHSADQIAASAIGFQTPGRPPLGYWFPLDALEGRLGELWRAAFTRQGYEFEREMWSLEYWLVMKGVEHRSGELLEVGLRSGLISYQVAHEAGRSKGHVHHQWLNLKGAAWWQLTKADGRQVDANPERFVKRLIEYLQEYGNILLREGDVHSLRALLAEFRQSFYDAEERRWMYQMHLVDQNAPLSNFEYAVMALLALAGRAMTLKEQGQLSEIGEYLHPIHEMIDQFAPIERFVPAAYEPEGPLHQQWSWWEMDGEERDQFRYARIASEHYAMLPLLVNLLRSGSTAPLPSLRGYAQSFIDAWTSHKDVVLDIADVAVAEREEVIERFTARLATAKAAEEREAEDIHLSAPIDTKRVSTFLQNLRMWRQNDRVLETCFEKVGRVRRLKEDDWKNMGSFVKDWWLPRWSFVEDVIPSTTYSEWHDDRIVEGFEKDLVVALAEEIQGSSEVHETLSADSEPLMAAVDVALAAVGEGHALIAFVGNWSSAVRSNLFQRMYMHSDPALAPVVDKHYGVLGSYHGHWILWPNTGGNPEVAVINLERWGWLNRAPVDGEDFKVGLSEIAEREAEERARRELPDGADEETRVARVRELRLLVRAYAEERAGFEVEDPEAARIIRVISSDDNDADGEQ